MYYDIYAFITGLITGFAIACLLWLWLNNKVERWKKLDMNENLFQQIYGLDKREMKILDQVLKNIENEKHIKHNSKDIG